MSTDPSRQLNQGINSAVHLQPLWKPIGGTSVSAGYAVPVLSQKDSKLHKAAVAKAARKVLNDPVHLRLLSDRVYELMLEDLRHQRERSRNYGGRF